MVRLTRIYTRTGDRGKTRLGTGATVSKTDPRIEACGVVDEVNATLGLALAAGLSPAAQQILATVQNDLFDLGADLSTPLSQDRVQRRTPVRITAVQVARLESAIDAANTTLEPLRNFILPGGRVAAAQLHVARTVCRRAERRGWALVEAAGVEEVNAQALIYLNRLSDLLFVLARSENAGGSADVIWRPGGGPA